MAYPSNLGEILRLMGYISSEDFDVLDDNDGNGPYIYEWKHGDPEPTENDITTWYTNYLNHSDRLIEIKTIAKRVVDHTAELVRNKYLTIGSGQAMTYIRKETEAHAYKDAGYPVISGSPSNYPWIKAEMDATGNTGQECADNILTQSSLWLAIGTTIEKERRQGKINIDAASDESSVNTIKDTVVATLDAI